MNMKLEKAIASLILGTLIVTFITSIYSLSELGNPITRDEAIEISKNSELVKEGLAVAFRAGVAEANYYNSSKVDQMKKGHLGEMFGKVPEGHSVWEVVWSISRGVGGYLIIVVVDAEMGMLVHEEIGVGWE